MGNIKYLVLLEGKDDFHVVSHLLFHHQIHCENEERISKAAAPVNHICLKELKGIDKLLDYSSVVIDDGDLEVLGIVIDADENVLSRWDSVRRILNASGKASIPQEPISDGTIIELKQDGRTLRVGIWIMPNNYGKGFLEDFLKSIVPKDDFLFPYAVKCIGDIPEENRLFTSKDLSKAEIHTWLAWQEDPGKPFGIAVKAKYFDIHSPMSKSFVNWIQNLFQLKT